MNDEPIRKGLNPIATKVAEAAWLLAKVKGGAPTNLVGSINLVHHGACRR